MTLHLLGFCLAVDAMSSDGPRHQAALIDVFTARNTDTVLILVQSLQGVPNLGNQTTLAILKSQGEIPIGLHRGDVDGVGQGLPFLGQRADGGSCASNQRLKAFIEQGAENFEPFLLQKGLQLNRSIAHHESRDY